MTFELGFSSNHTRVAQVFSHSGRQQFVSEPYFDPGELVLLTVCILSGCAGWVAVTAHEEEELLLRAYTPKGTALVVREPPLLPYISTIRGARIPGTPAYRTKKPPSFVENLRTTGSR